MHLFSRLTSFIALSIVIAVAAVLWGATGAPGLTVARAQEGDNAVATPFVVTATPTPETVYAAATWAAAATEQAASVGTPTPLPLNWVLATNTPTPHIVTATPTPANEATAQTAALEATAVAATTGTPDSSNWVIVTPTPTDAIVYVTPTPPVTDLFAAATLSAQMTAQAQEVGTPTPFPPNWRVARVVAVSQNASPVELTAIAYTTAMPEGVVIWTATPRPPAPVGTATPYAVSLDSLDGTPTPGPTSVFPPALVGKILFLSDYVSGNPRRPDAFMINPDGSGLMLLTGRDLYDRAAARDAYSADRRYYAHSLKEQAGSRDIQIFYDDAALATKKQLTYFGTGVAWDPAWSPTDDLVAFVSNESKNDEIWVGRIENWPAIKLTTNTFEWDKSPSFSPDGEQIVFMSNRDSGRQQLWLMDKDGGNVHPLGDFPFEAWDPVWVKYTDQ